MTTAPRPKRPVNRPLPRARKPAARKTAAEIINNPVTDIVMLLDRSGSMESLRTSTVAGIQEFIREQQSAYGLCLMTLVQFDSEGLHDVIFEERNISAAWLNYEDFQPRSMTPLYDAIALAIKNTDRRIAREPSYGERRVIFVIVTDGLENNSRQQTAHSVAALVSAKSTLGWQFIFMGANQDAVLSARYIGIQPQWALTYGTSAQEVRATYAAVSHNISVMRGGMSANVAEFTDEQRQRSYTGGR